MRRGISRYIIDGFWQYIKAYLKTVISPNFGYGLDRGRKYGKYRTGILEKWERCRKEAERLGARLRPLAPEDAMRKAHRALTGSRCSDGFGLLEKLERLDLSLEALAVDKRYTALFTDDEANTALSRLLEAGYRFHTDIQ